MKALPITKKILKYSLIIFLVLLILSVGAVFFYKDKIIQLTFNEINKHLKTKIEINKDIELSIFQKFPEISIKLKDVRVYENLPQSKDKLAQFKTLYFSFDAIDFLKGRYVIQNIFAEGGDVRIKINQEGLENYDIFKKDTTSTSNLSFNLQNIELKDVMILYQSDISKQHHEVYIKEADSKIKYKESIWYINLNGGIVVHGIGIEENEYFKDKEIQLHSDMEYHEGKGLFKVKPSQLTVQGSEFNISGYYEGKDKMEIDLKINAGKSTISTLVSLLPKNISDELSVYKSSGSVFFEAAIKGKITQNENPAVNINFGFNNASFFHPEFNRNITKATLNGLFTNGENHNLSSSALELNNITAVFDGKPVSGNFGLKNFNDPYISFNFSGNLDINSILKFYPVSNISEAKGSIDANISFEGNTNDLKTKEGQEKVSASGIISLKDLYIQFKNSIPSFEKINGNFVFGKNDLRVDSLTGHLGKTDFFVKGDFKNFIRKIIFNKESLLVDAKIKCNYFNMDEVIKIFTSESSSSPESKNDPYPHLSGYKFKLNCDFKKLDYQRLHAKNFHAEIDFNQPTVYLKNVSMNTAGGKLSFYTLVTINSKEKIEVNYKGNYTGICVDSVFYICDNFHQDFILDKNLKGQISGDLRLFFVMDHNFDIKYPTLTAKVNFSIKNGELNNFEPIKKLAELKLIDVEQLKSIKFSELRNTVFIENGKVLIPEMEINSSVSKINVIGRPTISNIKVSGTHTFDQEIDYKLTVGLKNFFKNNTYDKDAAFGAIEEDTRGNTFVFVTIRGTTEDYKVSYDRKRTGAKIKEDLKKEKQELENIFKNKKDPEIEQPVEVEDEFFNFD